MGDWHPSSAGWRYCGACRCASTAQYQDRASQRQSGAHRSGRSPIMQSMCFDHIPDFALLSHAGAANNPNRGSSFSIRQRPQRQFARYNRMHLNLLMVQPPHQFLVAVVEMINPVGCVGQNHQRLSACALLERRGMRKESGGGALASSLIAMTLSINGTTFHGSGAFYRADERPPGVSM